MRALEADYTERALVREWADRLAALDGWQSMDSAPKGGGAEMRMDQAYVEPPRILLQFPDGEISVAYWDWYYAEGGGGCTDGVAWTEPVSGEPVSRQYGSPVKWKPLPTPPKETP